MITPKNWGEFQHYKDRAPAWIKLHRKLLDDYAFSRLPVASRALAPLLWLLASEYEGGQITAANEELAFRFRMTEKELTNALQPLIDNGFFQSDSAPLAERKHDASLEKRERRDREEERRARPLPEDFEPDKETSRSAGLSNTEADRELQKFKNYAKAHGKTYVDWQAAWRNWCAKSAEFMGRAPPPPDGKPIEIPGHYAQFGSAQLEAWAAYERASGKSHPRDKNGGWRFPTEWPPGHQSEAA